MKIYLYFIFIIIYIKFSNEMEKYKLSVIIPVYNVERYLAQCLNSIIKQKYKNLEIICINDGSKDNSLKILRNYEKKDNRIKVYDQTNHGVSYSRNKGIELSTGEYITFVDSDDMVNLDAYAKSMKNIIETDSDIVCYDIKMKRRKKIRRRKKRKNKMRRKIYVNDNINAMRDRTIYPSICNKIFRRKLINDYNIRFKKELYFGEDDLFRLMSFAVAKKISLLPNVFYIYRRRRGSTSTKMNSKKYLINNIKRFKFLIEFFYENKLYNHNNYLINFGLGITYRFVHKLKKKSEKQFYAKEILNTFENTLIKNDEVIDEGAKNRLDTLKKISEKNKTFIEDL